MPQQNRRRGAAPAPAAEELPVRAAASIEDKCAAAAARFGRLFSSVKIVLKRDEVAGRSRGLADEILRLRHCPEPAPRVYLSRREGYHRAESAVDLRNNEHLTPAFRAINPDATVPVLELDNGTRITDAIGICVYFEAIQPQPALMGESAEEKAVVTAWQRISERNGFYAVMEALRNSTPGLKSRALPGPDDYEQIPALAERGRARFGRFFEQMDARLAQSEFVAGARYSIADITTLVSVDFARWVKLAMPEHCAHLRRWHEQVSARPSAKA
jgi:glutathione S-transferase